MDYFTAILSYISSLISVLNPIGAVPLFLSFTGNKPPAEIRKIALKSSFYVCLILVVSFVGGSYVMNFFGITFPSMKIAGGLIMLISGMAFLNSQTESHKGINKKVKFEAIEKEDISFTPLAMPLLAGPGSMSYLISLNNRISTQGMMQVLAAVLLVCVVIFLVLQGSKYLLLFLGNSGIVALSRVMGFFVMCIGIEGIINGVRLIIQTL